MYIIQTLWIFHFYIAYFSLFLLIYNYLYSVSLKTLPFFKGINFILCILFFSLSSLRTVIQHYDSFRGLLCLTLSYCESVIFLLSRNTFCFALLNR